MIFLKENFVKHIGVTAKIFQIKAVLAAPETINPERIIVFYAII